MIATKLLASVLALGVVGGGAIGTNAIQLAHAIQPTSTVSQEEKAEKQDPNEQAKLQKEATITQDEATKTVLEQYQDGTIDQVELEDEDGSVVYGFDVVSKDGKSYDVKVDAKTGEITKADNDNEAVDNDKEVNDDNEAVDNDKEVNDDNQAQNN
ncbi:PepSY domain-containing protein [Peribacillus butanolivorans]|uniref:PepSY domain-containing protein n=1 Tax=Peribacillus butanolivorans TaxID=421767 RepID=UPI0035D65670